MRGPSEQSGAAPIRRPADVCAGGGVVYDRTGCADHDRDHDHRGHHNLEHHDHGSRNDQHDHSLDQRIAEVTEIVREVDFTFFNAIYQKDEQLLADALAVQDRYRQRLGVDEG